MLKRLIAGAAGAGAMMGAGQASPLLQDLRFDEVRQEAPRALGIFQLFGRDASFSVYGRQAAAQTAFERALIREAQAMDRVMPGYPQPARVTFAIQIIF